MGSKQITFLILIMSCSYIILYIHTGTHCFREGLSGGHWIRGAKIVGKFRWNKFLEKADPMLACEEGTLLPTKKWDVYSTYSTCALCYLFKEDRKQWSYSYEVSIPKNGPPTGHRLMARDGRTGATIAGV